MNDQSLTDLWCAGDQNAAAQLFTRHAGRLAKIAGRRISQHLASRIDADDIVQDALAAFFVLVRDGRFTVANPDDLCKLLARITIHKTLRAVAHHQRDKRDARTEASNHDLPALVADAPSPSDAAAFADQRGHFFAHLQADERQVLEMRLEGYNNVEIATTLLGAEMRIDLVS